MKQILLGAICILAISFTTVQNNKPPIPRYTKVIEVNDIDTFERTINDFNKKGYVLINSNSTHTYQGSIHKYFAVMAIY